MTMAGSNQSLEEQFIDSPIGIQWYLQSFTRSPGIRLQKAANGETYMSVQVTGAVGPAVLADGTVLSSFRQGRTGEIMASAVHGDWYEGTSRGKTFFSYCAAQATTAVGTAMVGNIVWNPPGSGVNLSILGVGSTIAVTSATVTEVLLAQSVQTAVPGTTTAATRSGPTNIGIAGSSQGAAISYTVATLTTAPTAFYVVQHNTAAINTVGQGDDVWRILNGVFSIPPGNAICLATLGATAAASAHFSTLVWEEVPV